MSFLREEERGILCHWREYTTMRLISLILGHHSVQSSGGTITQIGVIIQFPCLLSPHQGFPASFPSHFFPLVSLIHKIHRGSFNDYPKLGKGM